MLRSRADKPAMLISVTAGVGGGAAAAVAADVEVDVVDDEGDGLGFLVPCFLLVTRSASSTRSTVCMCEYGSA